LPDAELLGVALRTPPFNLALAYPGGSAVAALVTDAMSFGALHGIIGEVADARLGAECWVAATGGTFTPIVALRVHELTRVEVVPGVGTLRAAVDADRKKVEQWEQAFFAEALPSDAPHRSGPLSLDGFFLWEVDGVSVAMARGLAAGPHTAVITAVYTPPEHRRRGYATSAVAALSGRLLEQGYASCVLFTDLANPTSNAIYRLIGYRPVGDFSNLVFHDKPA
jgi:ribosomal protein S18 acetylase RimI-like enzyme